MNHTKNKLKVGLLIIFVLMLSGCMTPVQQRYGTSENFFFHSKMEDCFKECDRSYNIAIIICNIIGSAISFGSKYEPSAGLIAQSSCIKRASEDRDKCYVRCRLRWER